jgi:hypothetical protein
MNKAQTKASELVDSYRMILMNEDTDCGNEILCTQIAKQCVLILCEEMLSQFTWRPSIGTSFWEDVKYEILKL